MTDRKYCALCVLILIAAFTVRLGVAFYWDSFVRESCANVSSSTSANGATTTEKDGPFFFGDSDSYWKLGRAIAFGRPYEFDSERHWQIFRTPGYPAILAPIFWFFGENPPVFVARLQGVCFGTFNVALVMILASTYFKDYWLRRWITILSALCVSVDPTLALQSVCVLSEESFMTFALALNIVVILSARRLGLLAPNTQKDCATPRALSDGNGNVLSISLYELARQALPLAFFATVATYIRPSWLYFLPFAYTSLLLVKIISSFLGRQRESANSYAMRRTVCATVKLAVFVVTLQTVFLSPWIYRNLKLTGRIIPTSLQMGASLYDGLNPNATGASNMTFVDEFRNAEHQNPSDSPDVHFEVRLDKRLKDEAALWALNNPQKVARLACVKLYRLWAPVPREPAFSRPELKCALFLSYTPILLLAVLGAYRSFRRQGAVWSLALPALYLSLLHIVFVSSIRYRTPATPGLAVLAAYWLVTSYEWKKGSAVKKDFPNNAK